MWKGYYAKLKKSKNSDDYTLLSIYFNQLF